MTYITRKDDISALPLSVRSQNCLRSVGVHTVGEMMDYPTAKLFDIRNMGKKSVCEVQSLILMLANGTGEYVLAAPGQPLEDESFSFSETTDTGHSMVVFVDKYGAVTEDLPVEDLPLSLRAKNSLIQGGYPFLSLVFGATRDELMHVRNLGKKTVEEILTYTNAFSEAHRVSEVPDTLISSSKPLAEEMATAYGETESTWLGKIVNFRATYPEVTEETLLAHLYDDSSVRDRLKRAVIGAIEENGGEITRSHLEKHLPRHLAGTMILEEALLELESASAIEIGEIIIARRYPSILDFAAGIENNRIRKMVQSRLEGRTLQEIGEEYELTRERVRQIVYKELKKRPRLREDQYAYAYNYYDFSPEDFTLTFDEPHQTYHYLELTAYNKRGKRKPLEDMLSDPAVAPKYRKKAERAIYKQYIATDGVRVKIARPDLVKHYIKIFCKDLTKFTDFISGYHEWLDTLGLGENPALRIESRAYENRLNQSDYVLWNQWRSFRYYNIPERDFEELLSTIRLDQFQDTEFSTLKLFRDYPDLMKQNDIRNEYELHNLLKKILPADKIDIKFKKMPTIEIGNADPSLQMLSLLLEYSPITADDLAMRYEEEYGVKAATVLGSYLQAFNSYYYQGVYSVDFVALPAIQSDRMKHILDQDFYTISEVKRRYREEFPDSDPSLINPYTLMALGFRVYSCYMVKNIYPSASDYFRSLLTTDDVVDARDINKTLQGVGAYFSELYKLRADYEIVEFSPLQYMHIRKLNALGVTTDDFQDYCQAVYQYYDEGTYFTVKSLRTDGFTHAMDRLNFDEWFYASILLEDREHFSYQRLGGTRIFLCGESGANLGDMLFHLLEKYRKMDFQDLKDLLKERYGIVLANDKLLAIIDGADLYYDRIMETVYIDYKTYFAETEPTRGA